MKIIDMHETMFSRPTGAEIAELCQISKIESIGAVATGIAHDFNNLLTPVILAMDELQRSSHVSAWQSSKLEHALSCAERAQRLVQRLLNFTQKKPATREAVDMVDMSRGMIELFLNFLSTDVCLELDFPTDLPPVMIDRDQIETALLNLIVNARDAMPDGGKIIMSAAVEICPPSGACCLQARPMLRVSITDTGIGMNNETLERAMHPFFSTKKAGKGTGLGLPLVHATVKQLGGHISITSKIAFGTCVDLWLPLAEHRDPAFGAS